MELTLLRLRTQHSNMNPCLLTCCNIPLLLKFLATDNAALGQTGSARVKSNWHLANVLRKNNSPTPPPCLPLHQQNAIHDSLDRVVDGVAQLYAMLHRTESSVYTVGGLVRPGHHSIHHTALDYMRVFFFKFVDMLCCVYSIQNKYRVGVVKSKPTKWCTSHSSTRHGLGGSNPSCLSDSVDVGWLSDVPRADRNKQASKQV